MNHHQQSDQTVKRVGCIGLGKMGAPMAANLIRAGFEVTVWNRTESKCAPLIETGATIAGSPRELASTVDVVCVNVTDTPDVEAVLFGDDGIVSGANAGLIVIDHSTISPVATKAFAERLAGQHIALVDAPVSGGDVGAQAGTLSVMVGGTDETVEKVMPILQAVGQKIVHVGDTGAGQACKACNQIAVVCSLMGVCEAISMAKNCGLDAQKMIEVVSGGAGGSWQLANLGPKILDNDFAPGFTINMVLKDLGILSEVSKRLGVSLNATALAESLFKQVAAQADGEQGTQALAKAIGAAE